MQQINLNNILKFEGSIKRLSAKTELQENIPVTTYRLTRTIRNEILNY